jgi:hypothetical protein
MNINSKIIQYLDYKGVSQREFTSKCNLSEGVLRRGKNIGSGYLINIKTNYPDLNMNWLLFDQGEMIEKNNNQQVAGLDDLKYIIELQKEKILRLEKELKNKEKTVTRTV